MPKISIITPTYNSEKTLDRTINALLNQNFSDFEYIVIDGLSKDKTLDRIKSFIPKFEEKGASVTIVSEADKGVYDAMNKGIKLAKGDLIGITNSDDWYEDNTLADMWAHYEANSGDRDNSLYYGIEKVWKDGKLYNVQRRGSDFISEGVLPHSTFFVPRKVYEKYGAFDLSVKILADYDFISRCASQGAKLVEVDAFISNFQLGGISSSYFDFYTDYYKIQRKYNYITDKRYKELIFVLKLKKLINKLVKRW